MHFLEFRGSLNYSCECIAPSDFREYRTGFSCSELFLRISLSRLLFAIIASSIFEYKRNTGEQHADV